MSRPTPGDDRKRELQADRALFGLGNADERELAALDVDRDAAVPNEFELTAAAIHLAMVPDDYQPLPEHLRQRILAATKQGGPMATATLHPTAADVTEDVTAHWRRRAIVGWLATAAALLVAFLLNTRGGADAPSPAEVREQLLATRRERPDDVVQLAWTRGTDATGAAADGDVVWSEADQAGVMRFRGLAANDPAVNQYQLWIFDANRDVAHPVDGGVFDIPAGAEEVLIPIAAKLHVDDATMFAITVERPGGVVVSDRSRLPLLAQVE